VPPGGAGVYFVASQIHLSGALGSIPDSKLQCSTPPCKLYYDDFTAHVIVNGKKSKDFKGVHPASMGKTAGKAFTLNLQGQLDLKVGDKVSLAVESATDNAYYIGQRTSFSMVLLPSQSGKKDFEMAIDDDMIIPKPDYSMGPGGSTQFKLLRENIPTRKATIDSSPCTEKLPFVCKKTNPGESAKDLEQLRSDDAAWKLGGTLF
jgi:hypothetical protein